MQTSHNNSEGISVVGKSSLRTCLMILILLNASSILLTTVTVNWWMYTILKEQLPTDLNLGSRTTISLFGNRCPGNDSEGKKMDSNTSPEQYCYSSTTHHLLDEIPGNRTDWEFCLESGIGVRDLVIYWEIGPG
ncbi:hypothetical protein Fcan01_24977 [Folsomia candida]|uniref:Uncharacterized protein n=1 Tax=Folsomia candida TaxID=158441 RepID=A0A226D487_FOLCA|nr:hypothetical protein Fcan01_24977 [Folsomia candida]